MKTQSFYDSLIICVKESVEKGLPLIPFPLPMFMIAENHIANKKQNSKDSEKRRNSVLDINESISLKSHSKNLNKRTNFESDVEEELRKKSLDKLVNEAKHELEQETLKKKVVNKLFFTMSHNYFLANLSSSRFKQK